MANDYFTRANLNNARVINTYLLIIHAVQLLLIAAALMTLNNRARIRVFQMQYNVTTIKFTVNLTYSTAQQKCTKKKKNK